MPEYRYKAFISYSHVDERWAKWLHRALETYPVPSHLVGTTGPMGMVGKRVAPVFRDRDELATSGNLSLRLAEALEESAALILICSPAARASQWADEEVRRFQALGRANRVFCVLVDGDASKGDCFPPALFDGVDDAEPLFADPRDWADGKLLARQKVIAGLLGVPLDEIRQRDLKRRRRIWTVAALGALVALALTIITVSSKISEQQEREKAEQLASFVVDLGERIRSDVDLETLGIIGQEAMKHLDTLDPAKLTPGTRVKVGLALRQIGLVNLGQGNAADASVALNRSLDLFTELSAQFPDEDLFRFELSQAEFYVFDYYMQQGVFEKAEKPMYAYLNIANQLYAKDPDNRQWLLELSYSTGNVLAWKITSGQPVDQNVIEQAEEAMALAEQALAAWPGDSEVMSHFGTTLAWAADVQLMVCRIHESMSYREQTLEPTELASRDAPGNRAFKVDLAFAHSGVAMVRNELGELDAAEQHRRESNEILAELILADASNLQLQRELGWREFLLARLLSETGREQEAMEMMNRLAVDFEKEAAEYTMSDSRIAAYVQFLLTWTEMQSRPGVFADARPSLDQAIELLSAHLEGKPLGARERILLMQARFLWWQIYGEDIAGPHPVYARVTPDTSGEYRGCVEAELAARLAIMTGDREMAAEQVQYLQDRAYAEPSFMRFCRGYGLCPNP